MEYVAIIINYYFYTCFKKHTLTFVLTNKLRTFINLHKSPTYFLPIIHEILDLSLLFEQLLTVHIAH